MSFTIIVTRDVQLRYRGFLASIMLEIAPGTYVSPRLSPKARDVVWDTVSGWHQILKRGSITMVWRDTSAIGNVSLKILGDTRNELINIDDIILTRRSL